MKNTTLILTIVSVLLLLIYGYSYKSKICKKIIIVGNANTLVGKNLGSVIDSYDDVIRINNFKTKGYEKDVGTKTTGVHINESISSERMHQILEENDLKLENLKWFGIRPGQRDKFSSRMGLNIYDPRIEAYNLKKYGGWCRNLTSGTLIILHFLTKCTHTLDIAGITGYTQSGSYYDNSQKHKKSMEKQNNKFHCPIIEKKVFNDLIKSKRVRLIG